MQSSRTKDLCSIAFGFACLVGLVGAFIGLNVSSFWVDELFTSWVVGHGDSFGHVASRFLTDVHPPVYYALLYYFSRVFGDSDFALRLFSAICASLSIMVFLTGTDRYFSLNARLFSGALATGSYCWFYQSQNARDYSLSMLIGSLILAITIFLIREKRSGRRSVALLFILSALFALGSFVHFYAMYESIAVLVLLFIYMKPLRPYAAITAVALFVSSESYLTWVIKPHTVYSTTSGWIPNTVAWYLSQLKTSAVDSLNQLGLLAILICLAAAFRPLMAGLGDLWTIAREARTGPWSASKAIGIFQAGLDWSDSIMTLCIGVPIIMLVGAVLSSAILAPNFSERNFLVCSPYLWGFYARLYDVGVARARPGVQVFANLTLICLVLLLASIVVQRSLPRNEPYREATDWVKTLPACRGQLVPVIVSAKKIWKKAGQAPPDWTDHYLAGFASAYAVYMEDIKTGDIALSVKSELQRRVGGSGCPVVGLWIHGLVKDEIPTLEAHILSAIGSPTDGGVLKIREFRTYDYGLNHTLTGPSGIAIYAGGK